MSPHEHKSGRSNSGGKDEEITDIGREKDVLPVKDETKNTVDDTEQESTKTHKPDSDAKLEPHDHPAMPPSGSFVNQKAEDVTGERKDVTAEPNEAQAGSLSHRERYHNAHITNQADFEVREKLDAADGLLRQVRPQPCNVS